MPPKAAGVTCRHERMTATAAQRLRARGVTSFRFVFWLCLVFYAELAAFAVEFAQEDHGPGQALMGYTYPIAKASAQSIKARPSSVIS